MKNKVIVHATLHLKMGGLETVIMDLCRHNDFDQYQLKILCFNGYDPLYKQELERLNIEVVFLQRQGRYDISFFWKMRQQLRQWGTDVIHAHSGCVFNTILCACLARVPVKVVTEHGLPFFADGRVMETSFKSRLENKFVGWCADSLVAVSDEIRDDLLKRFPTCSRKVETIINGIDVDLYNKARKERRQPDNFSLPDDALTVGSVGRLVPIKNYPCLIRACAKLKNRFPNMHLLLVGDGPERQRLERLISDLDMKKRVTILGVRNDIARILPFMDIFVLPSLTEGTSISLLEAQAAGLPAVVTNVGGNPHVVKDGINGLLVDVNNIEQLTCALDQLFDSSSKRNEIGEAAYVRVRDDYDILVMTSKYSQLYQRLLQEKNGTDNEH